MIKFIINHSNRLLQVRYQFHMQIYRYNFLKNLTLQNYVVHLLTAKAACKTRKDYWSLRCGGAFAITNVLRSVPRTTACELAQRRSTIRRWIEIILIHFYIPCLPGWRKRERSTLAREVSQVYDANYGEHLFLQTDPIRSFITSRCGRAIERDFENASKFRPSDDPDAAVSLHVNSFRIPVPTSGTMPPYILRDWLSPTESSASSSSTQDAPRLVTFRGTERCITHPSYAPLCAKVVTRCVRAMTLRRAT